MDCLVFILTIVGGVTILGFIVLVGVILWELIIDKARELKWQYKYKHRFDKPPTAQCYCKDCKYYKPYEHRLINNSGRCGRGHIENWSVCDSCFCWQAEPLKSDPESVKED